jgi:NADPH:quinone reductase-like Zn-dependent oxidoreductase
VIRFHDYGEPADVLREEHVTVADPAADRIRVRVIAVGLNPADWELCRGFMSRSLPRGIGYDVAGVVDAVGAHVGDIASGDVVFGTADFLGQPSAGVADVAMLDRWYRVPDNLDPIAAAVLPMAVQTATWTLDAMALEPDTTLLVHGAGAMVGFAAVQIALRRGARVIATAGPSYTPKLTAMGAQVTTYGTGMAQRVRELAAGTVDLVFDAAPPNPGIIPELITIAGNPGRVMTISNHDEARRLGARGQPRPHHRPGTGRYLPPPTTPPSRPTTNSAFRSRTPTHSTTGGPPSNSVPPATPAASSSYSPNEAPSDPRAAGKRARRRGGRSG